MLFSDEILRLIFSKLGFELPFVSSYDYVQPEFPKIFSKIALFCTKLITAS